MPARPAEAAPEARPVLLTPPALETPTSVPPALETLAPAPPALETLAPAPTALETLAPAPSSAVAPPPPLPAAALASPAEAPPSDAAADAHDEVHDEVHDDDVHHVVHFDDVPENDEPEAATVVGMSPLALPAEPAAEPSVVLSAELNAEPAVALPAQAPVARLAQAPAGDEAPIVIGSPFAPVVTELEAAHEEPPAQVSPFVVVETEAAPASSTASGPVAAVTPSPATPFTPVAEVAAPPVGVPQAFVPASDMAHGSAAVALAEAAPSREVAEPWVRPPAPLVLLVSDGLPDWRGCELLLRVNGLEVRVARDAVEALAIVRRGAVAVVLTAYVQARLTGLELCECVHQASPATQVLLFASAAPPPAVRQRIAGLPCVRLIAATAPQPDVLNAVRQALECTMGFSGSFFGVSMVDLLQLFHLSRRTVSVFLGGPVSGSVHFHDGEVIHAEALPLSGEDALLEILDWNAGTVRMSVLSAGARTIERPFHNLLLDTLRRLDERRAPPDSLRTQAPDDIVAAIERALSDDSDTF